MLKGALLLATLTLSTALPLNLTSSGVLLQGFDWPSLSNRANQYSSIGSQASAISKAGFTGVWFPPPSQSVDPQGYLPQQWYTLEGDTAQRSAVKAIRGQGLMAIADVVVNHRTAPSKDSCTNDYTAFANPQMGDSAVVADDAKCDSGVFCPANCDCGARDTGDNFCGAPDLDHTSNGVQDGVKAYLAFLGQVGYTGVRWDMVKGYGAQYVGGYVKASDMSFSVGEFFDGDVNKVYNWALGTGSVSNAFDFPLRYVVRDAINGNDYSSLQSSDNSVMRRNPSLSVPFIDNHDTARNDRFGSQDTIMIGYAYILTHPGTPCVFWEDWNSYGTAINALIAARARGGVETTSSLNVVEGKPGLYAAFVGSGLAVKMGTADWSPGDGWTLHTSGNNFAVWTK